MTRSLSKTAGILLVMTVLCTIPAHGQIVSYLDSSGKRVFINADPPHTVRRAKASLAGAGTTTGMASRTTQISPIASPVLSAAAKANREKIEEMIREVSARYR